jgi:hypothetical protein
MWGTGGLVSWRRLKGWVSVPVGRGGVLILRRVLGVPRHLFVCGGQGRVIILSVNVVDDGTLGRISHREGVSPFLIVIHPSLGADAGV